MGKLWKHIVVSGTPYEIGYKHGKSLKSFFTTVDRVLKYLVKSEFKISFKQFMNDCKRLLHPAIKLPEYTFIKEELQGISDGAGVSFDWLVAWNGYLSMATYYEKPHIRCSAFVAVGSATVDGDILMAHSTHSDYRSGRLFNIIMDVEPDRGSGFRMQTAPGLICSSTDWFLCKTGIIGCETTITNLNYQPDFESGVPYFLRVRKAMQFAENLDEFVTIMTTKSAGDYACTWLLADKNTGEIMMLDNGLNHHGIKRTTDGIFHASNEAGTEVLQMLETTHDEHTDPSSQTGARWLRMDYLLNEAPLSVASAKRIMTDHYDVYNNRIGASPRTICRHKKHGGATDLKIVTGKMAPNFYGAFGPPCKNKTRKFVDKK